MEDLQPVSAGVSGMWQFHTTGMDELGYRSVFRYLGGTKYLLRFMAYNDLDNLE